MPLPRVPIHVSSFPQNWQVIHGQFGSNGTSRCRPSRQSRRSNSDPLPDARTFAACWSRALMRACSCRRRGTTALHGEVRGGAATIPTTRARARVPPRTSGRCPRVRRARPCRSRGTSGSGAMHGCVPKRKRQDVRRSTSAPFATTIGRRTAAEAATPEEHADAPSPRGNRLV